MVKFEKTQDRDMKICYYVLIDGECVDYIGVAKDTEWYGEGWINGSSRVCDIIGGGFDFKSIKQAFIDNEQAIKACFNYWQLSPKSEAALNLIKGE